MNPRPNPRRAGVLLHPTSLPGPHGAGDLGAAAWQFVDWLAEAECRTWQVLPLVPPGAGHSPYSSGSAFAVSPWLLALEGLVRDGLLRAEEVGAGPGGDPGRVDFPSLYAYKGPLLDRAAARLDGAHPLAAALAEYITAQAAWLEDTALFFALKAEQDQRPWWQWPDGLRDREPAALAEARTRLAAAVHRGCALQFLVDRQWRALRAHANGRGVEILGDLPIYVDADSADVWVHRELFALDGQGQRTEVAGVPPDAFSEVGQLWGNPLYRWEVSRASGHAWWVARVQRALALHDRVRIDHFRAFSAYWAVSADAPDARSGRWVPGPGAEFFEALRRGLGVGDGPLPIIAEDLGVIDQGVKDLLAASGLPGMHVLQFAFGATSDNLYLPHNHRQNGVVYPGTHDNNTTLGWWFSADDRTRDHVRRYFRIGDHDVVWDLIGAALASVCDTAIIAAQDLLALDARGRMNTPGLAEGNWAWRLPGLPLHPHLTARLRDLIALYGRTATHR